MGINFTIATYLQTLCIVPIAYLRAVSACVQAGTASMNINRKPK